MRKHDSSCLEGPVLGSKDWWLEFGSDTAGAEQLAGIALDIESPPIRVELVERIRAEIQAGTYDTPARWAMSLDRLEKVISQRAND